VSLSSIAEAQSATELDVTLGHCVFQFQSASLVLNKDDSNAIDLPGEQQPWKYELPQPLPRKGLCASLRIRGLEKGREKLTRTDCVNASEAPKRPQPAVKVPSQATTSKEITAYLEFTCDNKGAGNVNVKITTVRDVRMDVRYSRHVKDCWETGELDDKPIEHVRRDNSETLTLRFVGDKPDGPGLRVSKKNTRPYDRNSLLAALTQQDSRQGRLGGPQLELHRKALVSLDTLAIEVDQ
jgi:hypothetical protein